MAHRHQNLYTHTKHSWLIKSKCVHPAYLSQKVLEICFFLGFFIIYDWEPIGILFGKRSLLLSLLQTLKTCWLKFLSHVIYATGGATISWSLFTIFQHFENQFLLAEQIHNHTPCLQETCSMSITVTTHVWTFVQYNFSSLFPFDVSRLKSKTGIFNN